MTETSQQCGARLWHDVSADVQAERGGVIIPPLLPIPYHKIDCVTGLQDFFFAKAKRGADSITVNVACEKRCRILLDRDVSGSSNAISAVKP